MFPEVQRFLDLQGLSLTGKPKYRIVWSDDEFETRIGTYDEYSGNIFLRTVKGAKMVPKYPYVRHRWILEKYFSPDVAYTECLPDSSQGLYEPLFVFQDKYGNPLPVVLKYVEIIVKFDQTYSRSTGQKSYEDSALNDLKETREFNELLDSIDTSVIQSQLHMKEAIIRP